MLILFFFFEYEQHQLGIGHLITEAEASLLWVVVSIILIWLWSLHRGFVGVSAMKSQGSVRKFYSAWRVTVGIISKSPVQLHC